MENASKALIIAGAIILSVLLIVLGMYFYNQSSATKESAGSKMSELEMQQFNSEFENYVGSGKTYNQVISMLNMINSKNAQNAEDVTKLVEVVTGKAAVDVKNGSSKTVLNGQSTNTDRDYDTIQKTITSAKSYPKQGKKYKISVGYDTTTGIVYQVGIQEEPIPTTPTTP